MVDGYALLYLAGVFLASCGQLLLKAAALRPRENLLREYLNPPVFCGYGLLALSSLLTVFAYRGLPLSLSPVLSASSYLFIGAFGALLFRERVTRRRLCGYCLIILGVCLAAL